MKRIILYLKILDRFIFMFLNGKKIGDIKSLCLADYANYLMVKNNFQKAIKYYNMAISLNPNNPYAYSGLADAQVKQRLFKEALESCNRAISIEPSGRRFVLQSVIYKLLKDNISAEKALHSALGYFGNSLTDVYNQAAYSYREFKMYEEAEYYCKELIIKYPKEAGAYFNLANIYLAKGQSERARKEFQKGLELTTDKRYRKYAEKELRKIENIGINKPIGEK